MKNKEIEKLEVERKMIFEKVQILEQQKGELITRLAEIQGIIKYLKEKEEKENAHN